MTTSPVKWMTDAEFMAAPIREKALAVADSLVGQREIGDNRGPFVQRLLAKVGLGPGFPWCAAFISNCLVEAGFKGGPSKGRAAVRNWAKWAVDTAQITKEPERGDLFFWLNPNGTGHIGFFLGFLPNSKTAFRTIEGNTNAGGSREGDGVYKRTRQIDGKTKFIRWWGE